MTSKTQMIILISLVALLALVLFLNRSDTSTATNLPGGSSYRSPLITVDNPRLQIEKIESVQESEYAGTHRNVFSAAAPPPTAAQAAAAAAEAAKPQMVGPMPPPPPPPVTLPVKFFGYAADGQGNHRRAFFTNGEEVYIVAEGEMLLGHFRVLRIGNDQVEFEDTTAGRRGTQPIEAAAPSV